MIITEQESGRIIQRGVFLAPEIFLRRKKIPRVCQSQMEELGTQSCLNRGLISYRIWKLRLAKESTLEYFEPQKRHAGLFLALLMNRGEERNFRFLRTLEQALPIESGSSGRFA